MTRSLEWFEQGKEIEGLSELFLGRLRPIRKVLSILGFAFEIIWIGAVPSLFVALYSYLVIFVMISAAAWGWGMFVWVVPVVMLSPVVVAWYRVLNKRYRQYIKLMTSPQPLKWDIEAAVKGWVEITKLKKRKDRKD